MIRGGGFGIWPCSIRNPNGLSSSHRARSSHGVPAFSFMHRSRTRIASLANNCEIGLRITLASWNVTLLHVGDKTLSISWVVARYSRYRVCVASKRPFVRSYQARHRFDSSFVYSYSQSIAGSSR